VNMRNFIPDKEYNTKDLFEDFRDTYYGEHSDLKQRGFSIWLKKFALSRGWEMIIRRSNSVTTFKFQAVRR
jgi:hypothetical protein